MTIKRIHREISDLKREEMGGMTLGPTEQSLFDWRGSIPGPSGSCYDGGLFWMEITLPHDYPCVYAVVDPCRGFHSATHLLSGFLHLKSFLRLGMIHMSFRRLFEQLPDLSISRIYHMNISERSAGFHALELLDLSS